MNVHLATLSWSLLFTMASACLAPQFKLGSTSKQNQSPVLRFVETALTTSHLNAMMGIESVEMGVQTTAKKRMAILVKEEQLGVLTSVL